MTDYYTRPDGTQIAIAAMGRDELIAALKEMKAQRDSLLRAMCGFASRSGLELQDAANDKLDDPTGE